MTRRDMRWLVLLLLAGCGLISVAHAEDDWSAGAAPAPAVNAPAPVAHTGLTAEGSITTLYPDANPPNVIVNGTSGGRWTLLVDTKTSSISKNKQRATLNDLNGGDLVTVRYTEKDGENWVESLEAETAPTSPPAPDAAAPVPMPAMAASHASTDESASSATVTSSLTPAPAAETPLAASGASSEPSETSEPSEPSETPERY